MAALGVTQACAKMLRRKTPLKPSVSDASVPPVSFPKAGILILCPWDLSSELGACQVENSQ